MKLLINGIRGGDCVRRITNALLEVDLGARINFNLEAHLVRIEGRLTVGDATTAIERGGFKVASVVDDTVVDAAFRIGPHPKVPQAHRRPRDLASSLN